MVGKRRIKGGDAIILLLLTVLALLSFTLMGKEESIIISADGKEYVYPADVDRDITVKGPLGETEIRIEGGRAFITDSPCPNKTCMTKSIGSTITCLPNRVMITNPSNKNNEEVDSIAY